MPARGRRRIYPGILRSAWLLALVTGSVARAASFSDPYGTSDLLHGETRGVPDPLGRECARSANGVLSFSTAVELALCRNPATHAAWAAARQQAAALGIAESAWSPSLVITGSGTRTTGAEHLDPNGSYVATPVKSGDAAVQLSWTLFDFGARTGRIRNARDLLDAAAATTSSTGQQTVLQVAEAYYGLVAAQGSLDAARVAEAAYVHGLDVARGRRQGGAATLADVLQAETALNGAILSRVQAEAAVKTASSALAIAIGSRADEQYTLDPDPVPTQVPALRARVAELIDQAAAQRPDLAAARAQRDAAQAAVSVAEAAHWPTISLGAGHDALANTGLPTQNYNTIGFNITIPVFSGYSVTYGVRQAKAALEASEVNVEQIRLNVSRDVWNAYYALDSANQQLSATAALLKSAEQNQDVALGRYQAGVGTILDLLTAQAAAATARQQRVQAELAWQVARAQLVYALGALYGSQPLARNARVP